MKPLTIKSLIVALLAWPLITGCLEEGSEPISFEIFTFRYKSIADSVPTAQVQMWAENGSSQVTDGASLFTPDPLESNGLANEIELFGDPATNNSSLRVRMHRPAAGGLDYARNIEIELFGPIVQGQPLTGVAIVRFGSDLQGEGEEFNTDQPDTYLVFVVDDLDLENQRISGDFHFLARKVGDPTAKDPWSISEGAFTWPLDIN